MNAAPTVAAPHLTRADIERLSADPAFASSCARALAGSKTDRNEIAMHLKRWLPVSGLLALRTDPATGRAVY